MCEPISWWYVRHGGSTRLIISEKTDSHTEIAAEFGIRDNGIGDVCAGEFRPDEANPKLDLSTWKLVWDYAGLSRRPDWMDDEGEASLRRELEQRCAAYVFTTGRHEVESCRAFAFGDAELVIKAENCSVVAWDCSRVEARGFSSVVARDSSRVEARGFSSVVARDSSRVVAWDCSRVEARGFSSVVAWDCSRVEARDSSSVEARGFSSVVASGSSSVVAWDCSRVEAWGSSSVEARDCSSVVASGSSSVVAWDCSRVEARDSSRVVARDSSRVEARGFSSVVASSEYADISGRRDWDGRGYKPIRTDIKVGLTYTIKGGELVAVTAEGGAS